MTAAHYKVEITDLDYHGEHYTAWVEATSKNQAIAIAASLATRKKLEMELARQSLPVRQPDYVLPLMRPVVRAEYCTLDEYWAHRDQVIIEMILQEERSPDA